MIKRTVILLMASALLPAQAPTGELKVRLTAPLTTKMSRIGDLVVARIVDPAEYAGGYLEGQVREVHAAAQHSTIDFQFQSLHAGGKESRVSVGVVQIVNSKHQPDTDEDGSSIESARGSGGIPGISRIGTGVISRISKAGAKPAAGPPVALTKLAVKAPNLSLAPGSEMTVQFITPKSK